MPGASLTLFADLGACHVHKSSVTICVLPTPSGWRATRVASFRSCPPVFLSTPSGWRAIFGVHRFYVRKMDFYPRPPGGGRPSLWTKCKTQQKISIHALRVEGDGLTVYGKSTQDDFYPRPPGGGRRRSGGIRSSIKGISIHALRVEGDAMPGKPKFMHRISIHALRVEGDARMRRRPDEKPKKFLSTPSGWRATSQIIPVPVLRT